jgi:hypothetical protein
VAHIFRTFIVAFATLWACLGIHEMGHVAAAYLSGGRVETVVLFSLEPHVAITGAATNGQSAFRAVAGSATSILACVFFLLAAPRFGAAWQMARDTSVVFSYVELIAWSLSSLTHAHSSSPDDAERFLASSGASPYLVVAICCGLAALGLLAFLTARCNKCTRSINDEQHLMDLTGEPASRPKARGAAAS